MRYLIILLGLCFLLGCMESPLKNRPKVKKPKKNKLVEAKAAYGEFLKEAIHGAELLESHPDAEKLSEEIAKLNSMRQDAYDRDTSSQVVADFDEECQRMMRFFSASHKTIKYHKQPVPEEVAQKINEVCDGNAGAIRKKAEELEAKLETDFQK
jgi:hypothetical protein